VSGDAPDDYPTPASVQDMRLAVAQEQARVTERGR
jgi:hypothetical protein